jgi:hypothetical protein
MRVFRESGLALLANPGVRRSPLNYNGFKTPGIVDVRSRDTDLVLRIEWNKCDMVEQEPSHFFTH